MLGGQATTYRGHEGVRELFRDLFEVFAETEGEYPEIRDLGERLVAIGVLRVRGMESRTEIDSPVGAVVEYQDGKVVRVQTYLDQGEALQAAGLGE